MSLPMLLRGNRMDLSFDGTAYELENGDVLLVALVHGLDELERGVDQARAASVAKAFSLVPAGYRDPEPIGDWIDLIIHGIYGYGRKFIAKKKESPDVHVQP